MMLYQETLKYNTLLRTIKNRLTNLTKCLDGETLLDSTTESEFKDLIQDKTPPKWLAMSYPSSDNLPDYMINLIERVDYIRELVGKNDDERKYWLPGFFC
jgi:dynein heavy chain